MVSDLFILTPFSYIIFKKYITLDIFNLCLHSLIGPGEALTLVRCICPGESRF